MKIQALIKVVEDLHPYGIYGDFDSYSEFNQGWSAAMDHFEGEVEQLNKQKRKLSVHINGAILQAFASANIVIMALDLLGIDNYEIVDVTDAKFSIGDRAKVVKGSDMGWWQGEEVVIDEVLPDAVGGYDYWIRHHEDSKSTGVCAEIDLATLD